jgi:hypothetical protein
VRLGKPEALSFQKFPDTASVEGPDLSVGQEFSDAVNYFAVL